MTSPLRQIAQATLAPFHRREGYELELATFDQAPRRAVEALIANQIGLDLVAGERILAGVQIIVRPRGHEHRTTVAITDRVTAVAGWSTLRGPLDKSNLRAVIPHHALTAAKSHKAGFFENAHIALHTGAAIEKLVVDDVQPQLAAFFEALVARVPPQLRCEPPTPFVPRTEGDPAGVDAARAGLWTDDREALAMLAAVQTSMGAGMGVDVAADLVGRIVLAHRALLGAPAMSGNRWLSPLSADDFGHTLTTLFGAPCQHQPLANGHQLDFVITPQDDRLSRVLTAAGVASFLTMGVGFSPASVAVNALAGRQAVNRIRVVFGNLNGGTAFQLLGPAGSLERQDSVFATRVHAALCAVSYPVLLRRAQHGWNERSEILMAG